MAGTIYLVTNSLNGKQYVGQTIVEGNCVGHGTIMRKAYRKHGKKNFTYEQIKTGIPDRNTLNFIERFWIKTSNSQVPNGYNIENGGSDKGKTAESTKEKLRKIFTGFKHTDEAKRKIGEASRNSSLETRAKISASNKGRIVSEETRKKISVKVKGRKLSSEACRNIGLSKKGKKLTEEHKNKLRGRKHSEESKLKISQSNMGRKFSEETIEKIRKGNQGKLVTQETKDKLSALNKGKTLSAETKKKLSEAAKLQWIRQKGNE